MPSVSFNIHPKHPAFAEAGKKAGLEVWRIENFEPVLRPASEHGKFHVGDSYIILKTREQHSGDLEWDLHFWLGDETSQDEAGAAAIYTVQLDDLLGGGPIQYRETQEHESHLFLSLFKDGIHYLPGGVVSGFHHYDPVITKRLFQVKGKKHIRVKQVEVGLSSLNKGDCFILESGEDIFVYVGPVSKRLERIKAIRVANSMRDNDHGGRASVTVIDQFASEMEIEKFFETLGGGTMKTVPSAWRGGDDEKFEKKEAKCIKLYKVSDADGKMKIKKIAHKPLKREMLDSTDCYVLDTEHADLYVWIGKHCDAKEKSAAMDKAEKFLREKEYPKFTRIQRVVEDGEPSIFKQYFQSWTTPPPVYRKHKDGLVAYHCKLVDTHKLITIDVPDVEQEDLDEDDVMLIPTHECMFIWCGKDSSPEEREASTRKADRLKHCEQEHKIIEQDKEPEEFKKLFPKWDTKLWESAPSYEERRKQALRG